jgi:integrase
MTGPNRIESSLASELGIAKFSTHDLRRTGRTGLVRLGINLDIAERVLNHARGKIHAA